MDVERYRITHIVIADLDAINAGLLDGGLQVLGEKLLLLVEVVASALILQD